MKRATFAPMLLLGFAACAAPPIVRPAAVAAPRAPAPRVAPTPVASVAPSAEPPPEPEAPLAVPEDPTEPDEPNETARACKVDTADAKKAQQAIDAIDAKVAGLAADGDPKPIEAEIRRALHLPCLRLGLRDAPTLAADSGYALKQWWKDGGGKWWLRHYLELTIPRTPNSFPTSVVAPTVRRTLSLETRKKHPLRELLCSVQDAACGTETRGWSLRADDFFKRFAANKRGHWLDGDQKSDAPPPSIDVCVARAPKGPAQARYGKWRQCLDEARPKVARLPIGAVKAPTRGWLLLRGRRGHYSFCDEVRAYDLATGAAYVAKSCSGLALVSDGSVDGKKTDEARKDETLVGTVPRDALREAAWMMLLASEVQEDVVDAWGFALPVGVEPQRSPSEMGSSHGSFTMSSGQTRLAWSYMPDGASLASSDLTWPEDYNHPGREHAVSLLRIAEAGFVAGCASASPPTTLDWGTAKSAVSPIDAKASTLRKVDQELVVALGKARSQACAGK